MRTTTRRRPAQSRRWHGAGGSTAEPKDFDSIFPLTQTIAPMATIFVDSYRARDDDVVEAEMELLNVAIKHSAAYAFAPANQPVALPAGDDDFVITSASMRFNTGEITFDLPTEPESNLTSPQWLDANGDRKHDAALNRVYDAATGHVGWPLSYLRSTDFVPQYVSISVVFEVEGSPRNGLRVVANGTGPGGNLWNSPCEVDRIGNARHRISAAMVAGPGFFDCNNPVPSTIANGFLTIDWSIRKPTGTSVVYGKTMNRIYVNGNPPDGAYETLLHVGTLAAGGQKPDTPAERTSIFQSIWGVFASNVADGVEAVTGTRLKYWDADPEADTTGRTLSQLLSKGSGTCGVWCHFFGATLEKQGVQNVQWKVLIDAPNPPAPPSDPNDPYFNMTAPIPPTPVPAGFRWYLWMDEGLIGQGNPAPPRRFSDHQVAEFEGVFYDPSYGITFLTQADWEQGPFLGLQGVKEQQDQQPTDVTARFDKSPGDDRLWTRFRFL